MRNQREKELMLLVGKGLKADSILNNTTGYDCTFEEFKRLKNDSDLGKRAKDELVILYDDDVKKVVNYLMSNKNNGKKVIVYANNISGRDDYYQAGRLALYNAIDKYDITKNASLFTYAFKKIVYSIIDEARKPENLSDRDKKLIKELSRLSDEHMANNETFNAFTLSNEMDISIEEVERIERLMNNYKECKLEENTPDDELVEQENGAQKALEPLFKVLDEKETEIIKSHFGFSNSISMEKICNKYNLTDSDYAELIDDILAKMKGVTENVY